MLFMLSLVEPRYKFMTGGIFNPHLCPPAWYTAHHTGQYPLLFSGTEKDMNEYINEYTYMHLRVVIGCLMVQKSTITV